MSGHHRRTRRQIFLVRQGACVHKEEDTMSTRIEYIAKKVEKRIQTRESGTYDTRKFNYEFARDIIDICIDLVEEGVDHREPASTYADKIKDYFGLGLTAEDTMRNRSTYYGNNP